MSQDSQNSHQGQIQQTSNNQNKNIENPTKQEPIDGITSISLDSSLKDEAQKQMTSAITSDHNQTNLKEVQQTSDKPNQTTRPLQIKQSTPQPIDTKNQSQQKISEKTPSPPPPQQIKPLITKNLFEERLNQAIKYKNIGNQLFKNGDHVNAIRNYQEGLKLLQPSYFYGASIAEHNKMAQLSSNMLNNMGASYFNSKQWRKAQMFFTEAIAINPKYLRALYKRAVSRYQLGKYQDAFTDIKQAFSLDKTNKEVYDSYQKILQRYNEQVRKGKQQLKNFSEKMMRSESQKSLSVDNIDRNAKINKQNQQSDQNDNGLYFLGGVALVLLAGWVVTKYFKK